MRLMKLFLGLSLSILTVIGLAGCNSEDKGLVGGPDNTIKELEVTTENEIVPIDFTSQMEAFLIFTDGTSDNVSLSVEWESSDTSIATVNKKGEVIGVSPGEVSIKAQGQYDDINYSDSQQITVVDTEGANFYITPSTSEVVESFIRQYQAWIQMPDGTIINATELSQINWSVGPEGVAEVVGLAAIQGITLGTTTVTASVELNSVHFTNTANLEVVDSNIPIAWGDASAGGDISYAQPYLQNKTVTNVIGEGGSFCVLTSESKAVCFGAQDSSSVQEQLIDMDSIGALNAWSIALVPIDGSAIVWGNSDLGGDSSGVQNELIDIKDIQSNRGTYAALKEDGTVVTWGATSDGGDSSEVQDELVNVKSIIENNSAYAALKEDGTVVTWGGGYSSEAPSGLVNVKSITPSYNGSDSFAALKEDGTVVTWGDAITGGDSSSVAHELTNVTSIIAGKDGFAALKEDRTVVLWGRHDTDPDEDLVDIRDVYANNGSWVAIKHDGSAIHWGNPATGGLGPEIPLSNVKEVITTTDVNSFAALKHDGTVATWGVSEDGGDSSEVQNQLTNVIEITVTKNRGAYAALKSDGTVVVWGNKEYGGDSSLVQSSLRNIIKIYSNDKAFIAIK